MTGQVVGYKRVSTADQNLDRQLLDIQLDKEFVDKVSGKDKARPALLQMLGYVREGDRVVVHSLDRLGRNLPDLRELVETLTGKGVEVQFMKEGMHFKPDENNSMSTLLLSILGSFAEFERNIMLERQREGIAIAKAKGVYKGRKAALDVYKAFEALSEIREGVPKTKVAPKYGISRTAMYDYINLYGNQHEALFLLDGGSDVSQIARGLEKSEEEVIRYIEFLQEKGFIDADCNVIQLHKASHVS